jgi:hypothetical protein
VAEFIPLARLLRPGEAHALPLRRRSADALARDVSAEAGPHEPNASPGSPVPRAYEALDTLGGELRILRIAACESFENEARRLLERLACDVLGRELALAPCDLGAIVAAARSELAAHEPLCLVTAPGERAEFPAAFPRRFDPCLAPGDLHVELRGGALDVSLDARRERALEGLGE